VILLAKKSASVTRTATTISAASSDNSYNDSGSLFLSPGFEAGMSISVSGFTGDVANNSDLAVIVSVTATKMIVSGVTLVDDAAGESVTITAWESRTATAQDIADLAALGSVDASAVTFAPTTVADWNGSADPGNTDDALDQLADRLSTVEAAPGGASTTQTGEAIAGFLATPTNKDYRIVVKAPHGGTITDTTTVSESGTCTATFKVNTTALGGTANSVSSSEQSQAHASANTFAAGDDIVITVSANAACAGMSFSIKYTRTLS